MALINRLVYVDLFEDSELDIVISPRLATVGSILAHSKTLMHSLYLEARDSSDWGDAPDPAYPTLASSNGASHMIDPFVCLGYVLDAEPDGQPDSLALGDDNDGNDDDDGITFPAHMCLGGTAQIVVTSWSGGRLSMWLDGNGDGDWSDPDEFLVQQRFRCLVVSAH